MALGWIWVFYVFLLGAGVGSFLNLLVSRLPFERSPIWPLGSRCLTCYQRLKWYDNIPLYSYLRLGGKCRMCGTSYSSRYFFVELLTAFGFVGLFLLEVIYNWHGIPLLRQQSTTMWTYGVIPWQAWVYFLYHATLFSLLLTASFCDIARREIPLSITMTGVAIGLIGSLFLPWPWPIDATDAMRRLPLDRAWLGIRPTETIPQGVYPWPLWGPLPFGLKAGTWQLGLATSVAGALLGLVMLRVVRFVFSRGLGKEALGLGDADLMMMAGSFLGWQPIIVAFFVGALAGLFLALPILLIRGNVPFAFGPGLALGILITWLAWPTIGPRLQPFFFDRWMMVIFAVVMTFGMFLGAVVMRRPPIPTEAAT